MDSLDSLYGILTIAIFTGAVLTVLIAVFLAKQQRGEILRRVGRWFTGL
jgi:hypothetical protein